MMDAARVIIAVVCISLSLNVQAAEDVEPWRHPEVLKAAIDIGMNAEQRPQFQTAITEMLQGYGADVRKLLRAHNQTNLPKKIEKKRKVRVKALDKNVAGFLNEDQMPAYESYRDTLLDKMAERAAARRR